MELGEEQREFLKIEDQEAQRILRLLDSIEERVRGMKERGIQVPPDEATKFARLDEKASKEQREKTRAALDDLIQVTAVKSTEEEEIPDEGDWEFRISRGPIQASVRIPSPNDPYVDAPSEKLKFRWDTGEFRDISLEYDTRDRGMFRLGIIFKNPEQEELSNLAVYNSGMVPVNDMRNDEAEIITNFAVELADMMDPRYVSHQQSAFSPPPPEH